LIDKEGKKMKKITQRYIPSNYVESIVDLDTDTVAYKAPNPRGGVLMMAFVGKRTLKPTYHYNFKNDEQADKFLNDKLYNIKANQESKRVYKAEQKARNVALAEDIKIGDIFHCGWGYSMSLNDFYVVTARKGSKLTLATIGSKYVSGDWCGGQVSADTTHVSAETFTKILKGDSFKVSESRHAYKCSIDSQFYENHLD
jgi:hypothetical protein